MKILFIYISRYLQQFSHYVGTSISSTHALCSCVTTKPLSLFAEIPFSFWLLLYEVYFDHCGKQFKK